MRHSKLKKIICMLLIVIMVLSVCGCGEKSSALDIAEEIYNAISDDTTAADTAESTDTDSTAVPPEENVSTEDTAQLDEHGSYTEKDDVALYIHLYGHLPDNFVTKTEARERGWEGGSLEDYFPGCCIGGDRFGNYEGVLPQGDGITYTECDIGTLGESSRGAKRIVFSNDGHIYYTDDHYETFTLLYGEE